MDIYKEYGKSIYEELKRANLPFFNDIDYKRTGLVITRCPVCGDSRKSKNKGHLYINCKPTAEIPAWVKCHRCGFSEVLNKSNYVLELLNIFSDENDYLRKQFNSALTKRFGFSIMKNNQVKKLKLLPPLNNEYTRMKLKYINERLGIKLTQEKIEQYKIIFNLKDFLSYNKIQDTTCSNWKLNSLDESYVGFLSTNNEFINFRIIDDKLIDNYHKRYENYNIFGLEENTRRFITVKGKVNIMKDIEINSCEGPMDLIGIREHIMRCDDHNKIYVANMGMSAYSLMIYFIRKGLIFNKLRIFADKGVNLDYYRELKKKLGYRYKGEIEIIYNKYKGEKDFGIPKDKIKLNNYFI